MYHKIKSWFAEPIIICAGPKQISSFNSNLTFYSTDYHQLCDPLPVNIIITTNINEDYIIYDVTSNNSVSNNFYFKLRHDINGLMYVGPSKITLDPIKTVIGKTSTYIVSFHYKHRYDMIFELSPFAPNQITIQYYH